MTEGEVKVLGARRKLSAVMRRELVEIGPNRFCKKYGYEGQGKGAIKRVYNNLTKSKPPADDETTVDVSDLFNESVNKGVGIHVDDAIVRSFNGGWFDLCIEIHADVVTINITGKGK